LEKNGCEEGLPTSSNSDVPLCREKPLVVTLTTIATHTSTVALAADRNIQRNSNSSALTTTDVSCILSKSCPESCEVLQGRSLKMSD
ncbi:hypothetical protein SPRG_20589, partial [Saprolegnia parasitica CBS 223.65]